MKTIYCELTHNMFLYNINFQHCILILYCDDRNRARLLSREDTRQCKIGIYVGSTKIKSKK